MTQFAKRKYSNHPTLRYVHCTIYQNLCCEVTYYFPHRCECFDLQKKEANFLTPYSSGQNGSHPISADFQFACTRGEIRLSGASPFLPPCCYSAAWWQWRPPPSPSSASPPSPPRPTSRPPPTVTAAVTSSCCCGGGARPPPRPLYQHLSENRKACVRTEELIVDNYVKIAAPQHCWIWQAIGQTKPHLWNWLYDLAQ